jgi:hypothetical protein
MLPDALRQRPPVDPTRGGDLPIASICTAPVPGRPDVPGHIRLFAVLGAWMEADVVEATIRNAKAQGCERVYLVDNDSPDDTVSRACASGAILARTFSTERYDERLRLRHMNDVMREVSCSLADDAWWLFLDGDEFPHGPWGMTLREYLATLDRRFRVVGARFFNHYPSAPPHYVRGHHPIDFQPFCEEISFPMCDKGHRKHPLILFRPDAPQVEADRGFHLVKSEAPLLEPPQPVFLHHFPFREEAVTRQRLDILLNANAQGLSRADASEDSATHMVARHRSMDAVYCGKWDEVLNFLALDPHSATLSAVRPTGVQLRNWWEISDHEHREMRRWSSRA